MWTNIQRYLHLLKSGIHKSAQPLTARTFCNKPPQAKKRRRIVEPNRDLLLSSKPDIEGVSEYETAFQNRLKSYFIRSDDNLDMTTFCNSVKDKILNRLKTSLQEQQAIKYNIFV